MINFTIRYGGTSYTALYNPVLIPPTNILTGTFFPFSFGQFLDDQLDEATVTAYGSTVHPKDLPIGSVISVEITGAGEDAVQYYKISNIRSIELPNGSGFYKHDLSLIELTKELEGINCQTITFTNSKYSGIAPSEKWVEDLQ